MSKTVAHKTAGYNSRPPISSARKPARDSVSAIPVPPSDDDEAPSIATNKSTAQILDLFSRFQDAPGGGLRVTELAKLTGMTKQKVIRALHTLTAQGYLVKSADGKSYELGYRLLEVANFDPAEPDLRQICAPYMQQMYALAPATIVLAVPVGYHAIVIDGLDDVSGRGFQLRRHRRGYPIPLNVGPLARAILAFLPDNEIQSFIRQAAPFSQPARFLADPDAASLWAHIRLIRERGYDIGGGELMPNASGVYFPILDATGYPLGSIGFSSTADRFGPDKLLALVPALMRIMDNLNQQTRMLHAG